MDKLAIISDVHANYFALKAVLKDIESNGIHSVICLGDMVGYGSMPNECITELRSRNIKCLLGNHDSYLIGDTNCERSNTVVDIINRHKAEVSYENKHWLSNLKSRYFFEKKLFVHGGPDDHLDQYIYSVSKELFKVLPPEIKILICGHTHVQTLNTLGDFTFLNPGSVGQPRDGDNRASYAIFDEDEIYLKRVPYDVQAAMDDASDKGYPPQCYLNLMDGAQIGGRIDKIHVTLEI